MAKKDKLSEKIREGVTVEDLEKFARKYTNEVFLILALLIATVSSVFGFFTGPVWSVLFMGILAIVALALPERIGNFLRKILKFQVTAEKSITIMIGIVRIIIGLFIPFVLFAELGLLAGYAFHTTAKEFIIKKDNSPNKDEEKNI